MCIRDRRRVHGIIKSLTFFAHISNPFEMRLSTTAILIISAVLAISVSAEFASTPFRTYQELTNDVLKVDPLYGWTINKDLGGEGLLHRTCSRARIFTSPQFTNGAVLSKNFTDVTEHDRIMFKAVIFLLGGWTESNTITVKIDGKEAAVGEICLLYTSPSPRDQA
eukprot:TRINITY_DN31175_c0_g1_i3.p2 TRINITY_DN31175_c0_g1~~TRINITY_DN31175_c0_g1_i3.p2  ORF type:complete len:166 (-),score=55.31 TRINITY_DN31175_c0_g1_i3:84-581(-)